MARLFASIRKESTRDKVYGSIHAAILSGKLRTGQRIAEIPLAAEFGVSRAIVREALQQLAHEGLVEQNSYKGTRVVRLTPEQIDEVVHVRLMLESDAVRLACERITEAGRRELRDLARRLDAATGNPRLFVELDLALHECIWKASGNETIRRVLRQITTPVFAMSVIMRTAEKRAQTEGNWRRGDHGRLVRAICEGDADEAVAAIRVHLTENWRVTRDRLHQFLARETGDTQRERAEAMAPK